MGDFFQTVVDLDAGPQDAARLAERVVGWLAAEGIVLAAPTRCLLGDGLGHEPGPHWIKATGEENADHQPYDGLEVHTERTVFHDGQGGPGSVICPRCGTTTGLDFGGPEEGPVGEDGTPPPGDGASPADEDGLPPVGGHGAPPGEEIWPKFGEAITTWYETGAAAHIDCPVCAAPVALTDWRWGDGWFSFGYLGFEFWNWPPLSEEFRARVADLLDGHRTAYHWGKL
ncbi:MULTISPECIES: hypothetical protein [unclassified Streptomyces]|uniref:Uncharacterized protein n=1 Tax=Streptomyces thermocoprophilus TaxID=78356 RepID=A0ABV5VCQ9_9ACTN